MPLIAFQILIQIVLILINAFFAATEIAVISLSANKLRKLEEEEINWPQKLLRMVEEPAGFLSTIQIGITLAGFLGSAFAADSFSEYIVHWICGSRRHRTSPLGRGYPLCDPDHPDPLLLHLDLW